MQFFMNHLQLLSSKTGFCRWNSWNRLSQVYYCMQSLWTSGKRHVHNTAFVEKAKDQNQDFKSSPNREAADKLASYEKFLKRIDKIFTKEQQEALVNVVNNGLTNFLQSQRTKPHFLQMASTLDAHVRELSAQRTVNDVQHIQSPEGVGQEQNIIRHLSDIFSSSTEGCPLSDTDLMRVLRHTRTKLMKAIGAGPHSDLRSSSISPPLTSKLIQLCRTVVSVEVVADNVVWTLVEDHGDGRLVARDWRCCPTPPRLKPDQLFQHVRDTCEGIPRADVYTMEARPTPRKVHHAYLPLLLHQEAVRATLCCLLNVRHLAPSTESTGVCDTYASDEFSQHDSVHLKAFARDEALVKAEDHVVHHVKREAVGEHFGLVVGHERVSAKGVVAAMCRGAPLAVAAGTYTASSPSGIVAPVSGDTESPGLGESIQSRTLMIQSMEQQRGMEDVDAVPPSQSMAAATWSQQKGGSGPSGSAPQLVRRLDMSRWSEFERLDSRDNELVCECLLQTAYLLDLMERLRARAGVILKSATSSAISARDILRCATSGSPKIGEREHDSKDKTFHQTLERFNSNIKCSESTCGNHNDEKLETHLEKSNLQEKISVNNVVQYAFRRSL